MPVENPNADADRLLGHPHVAVDLPPSVDGASFLAWQAHLSFACHVTLKSASDAPAFRASSDMFLLGQFILLQSAASHAHWMVRSGEDVARSEVDLMQISLLLEGDYAGQCGGRRFRAQAGDVLFVDYGQPFSIAASAYRMIGLLVPRSAMPPAFAQRSLHGFVPDHDRAAVRLFADAARRTYGCAPDLTMAEAVVATQALFQLADGMSLSEHEQRQPYRPSDLDLFSRAKAFIERHLAFGQWSAADAAGIACRALQPVCTLWRHRGLYPRTAVAALLRDLQQQCQYRRNHRRHCLLARVRSEAHFSRAFKQRFGLAPRALRLAAADRGANNPPSSANGIAPNAIQMFGR